MTETAIIRHSSGEIEGKHPRDVDDWSALGHERKPLLRVIREKCLACCDQEAEIRKCTAVGCALWPYRMATNQLRQKKELTDKQRAALRDRARVLSKARL